MLCILVGRIVSKSVDEDVNVIYRLNDNTGVIPIIDYVEQRLNM